MLSGVAIVVGVALLWVGAALCVLSLLYAFGESVAEP